MSLPATLGASHIAFTVRDLDASAEWYQRVFGWQVLQRYDEEEAGSARVLLLDPASFFVVALCRPSDVDGAAFDYRRAGLDHFALRVASEEELARWVEHLDGIGVDHSPVRVLDLGRFVSFEDPDGIQLELWV